MNCLYPDCVRAEKGLAAQRRAEHRTLSVANTQKKGAPMKRALSANWTQAYGKGTKSLAKWLAMGVPIPVTKS